MDDLLHHAQQLANLPATPIIQPIEGRVAYIINKGHIESNSDTARNQQLAEALNRHGIEALCMVRPGWSCDVEGGGNRQITPEANINGVRYLHTTLHANILEDERIAFEAIVEQLIKLLRIYRPSAVLAQTEGVGLATWVAAKRSDIAFYGVQNQDEQKILQNSAQDFVKTKTLKNIVIPNEVQHQPSKINNLIYQIFPQLSPAIMLNTKFNSFYENTSVEKTDWYSSAVLGKESIEIRVSSNNLIKEKKIIVKIVFFNEENCEVEPSVGSLHHSDLYGWFKYLSVYQGDLEDAVSAVNISIPEKAKSIKICLINFGRVDVSGLRAKIVLHEKSLMKSDADLEKSVFDFIAENTKHQVLRTKALIYGDVSPNVLDGSSIWLTSIANIVSSSRETILLLKDDLKTDKVIANLNQNNNLCVIQPKDIGFNGPLNQKTAAKALSMLHSHCPQVTALITRGVDLGYEIQKRKEFTGIFYPYLTDFYEVGSQGFKLIDAKVKKLKEIVLNARSVLFQTEEIRNKIEDIVGYEVDGMRLPPTIPENIHTFSENIQKSDDFIDIGYAGKVQLRWGVVELIEEVEKQIARGKKIRLHIATGKIYGKGKEGAEFVKKINKFLEKDFIKVYKDLSREKALSFISTMDLVWCYRDPNLENSTLELSTKLVETAALGKPCVVYASTINKNFLGKDYPFLIENPEDISNIIEGLGNSKNQVEEKLKVLANEITKNYTFSSLQGPINEKLDKDNNESLKNKKIVISGHDLKFIYCYVTHLRRQGAEVGIDPWEWGGQVSQSISEHYAEWADYIFCEWGLANAVWHSKNKKEGKKLFIRIHAQEVRKKAEKFGHAINVSNINKFIFVSPLIRKQALEMFGWDEDKTEIIPNAVKENRFYDPNREVKPILGMVGIVPTTKRLDRALDLLAALNERGGKPSCTVKDIGLRIYLS